MKFILLSLITFYIYGVVWCCSWIGRCNNYFARHGKPEELQVSTYTISFRLAYIRYYAHCCFLQAIVFAGCCECYLIISRITCNVGSVVTVILPPKPTPKRAQIGIHNTKFSRNEKSDFIFYSSNRDIIGCINIVR